MRASGLHGPSLSAFDVDEKEEDVLDCLLTEQRCHDLVSTCARLAQNGHQAFTEPYPLADKKTGRKFRVGLLRLWGLLIEKAKHEVIFDQTLIPWCIEWLCIISGSNHRGMRHTGTEVAMSLMVKLTELIVEVQSTKTAKSRQGASRNRATEASEADTAQLEARASELDRLVETIFKGIFLQRYRDTHDEVRVCCLNALGRCVALNQQCFLKDTYLKYLGWLLHDCMSASVRMTALQQLQAICKASAARREQLRHFVQRFEKRFIEMCCDVETKVRLEALRLLNQLYELDLLTDKRQTVIYTLSILRSREPALLRALAPLLQRYIGEDDGGEACTDASHKLVKLAMLICDQESPAGANQRARVCVQLVRAMAPHEPALSDWAAFTELLLIDSSLKDGINIDDEALQMVLLQLMEARASELRITEADAEKDKHDAGEEAAGSPPKKQRRAKTGVTAHDMLAMQTEIGKSLPQLLIAFGSSEQHLLPVLMLVQHVQLGAAQHTLQGSNFTELLHQLEVIYLKHHNYVTLNACAGAWRRLLELSAAPALQEQATVQYKRLCKKLLQDLKPMSQLVNKKGADFSEAGVALSRFALIARVGPTEAHPSLASLDGLAAKLMDALGAKSTASKAKQGLESCLLGLLQLQTSVLLDVVSQSFLKRGVQVSDDESVVVDRRVTKLRKELLPVLMRVLSSSSKRSRLLGFKLLSLVLVALSPKGKDASIHDKEASVAIASARRMLLDTLRLLMADPTNAFEKDDPDPDDENSLACSNPQRSPEWLNCALRCALCNGVPLAEVLMEMLYSAKKSKLVASQCKLLVTEMLAKCPLIAQAKIGLSVLISAFERVQSPDEDDHEDLRQLSEQLVWLYSHQRVGTASQLSAIVLELGIDHGLALIEQTTYERGGAFMDATLTPLLGFASQELASKLYAKLEVHLDQPEHSRLGNFISRVTTMQGTPKAGAQKRNKRAHGQDENEDEDGLDRGEVEETSGKEQPPPERQARKLMPAEEEEQPWDGGMHFVRKGGDNEVEAMVEEPGEGMDDDIDLN